MVGGGAGPGDEDRGPAGRRDLEDAAARAADDEIGRREQERHAVAELEHPVAVGRRHARQLAAAGHVQHRDAGRRALGERGGRGGVERAGAERAAEDRDDLLLGLDRVGGASLLAGGRDEGGIDRTADDAVARRLAARHREGQQHQPHERGRQAVGEPEVRVGLEQRRRDAAARRGGQHRAGHVAAGAEHHVGPHAAEDARAGRRRGHGTDRRADQGGAEPPLEAGHPEGVERVAASGHHRRLDALRRAGEVHLRAARDELVRDRERGRDVTDGAARRDEDARRHPARKATAQRRDGGAAPARPAARCAAAPRRAHRPRARARPPRRRRPTRARSRAGRRRGTGSRRGSTSRGR